MGEIVQQLLEKMMVLSMGKAEGAYYDGKKQGLQDAIDIVQKYHSLSRRAIKC